MTLAVYTARVTYGGPDRIDVTRKSATAEGVAFAPSWSILRGPLAARKAGTIDDAAWAVYAAAYAAEMRASYKRERAAWDALLRRERVVLVCFCVSTERCHRRLLARILVALGASDHGEINESKG